MKHWLAIYDMDKTVTRRPTFGLFLLHAALRLAPWRLLLAPAAMLASLCYLAGLIDRGRLKEINYRLLVGRRYRRSGSSRWFRASPSASLRPTYCRARVPVSPRTRRRAAGSSSLPPPIDFMPRPSRNGWASTT
jgi:hypothetical protein